MFTPIKKIAAFFGVEPNIPEDIAMNKVDAALTRKPRFGISYLSLITMAIIIILTIWAALSQIDEVTQGNGQVIASQRTQVIENLEGGILSEVLVREGEIVQKNQAIVRIDNQSAESMLRDAATKIVEHQLALIRLEAELKGQQPVFSAEIEQKYPQLVEDQKQLFATRALQFKAELDMMTAQYQQRQHDVEELASRQRQTNSSLALVQKQLELAKPLYEQKIYSRMDFLELQQKVVTMQGNAESLAATLPKAKAAADELEQKLNLRKAEVASQRGEEINKHRSELRSLQESQIAGSDKVARKDVRSPVKGTIKQIMLNTIGGTVRPGEPILEIVPMDDSLLIEARLKPSDIAFIYPGQKATVKISAYDFGIYGGLDATVENISADTIEDKRGEFFYLIRLRTKSNSLIYKDKSLPIIPGMIASVSILTGQKSILSYLLKPIIKTKQNALHER